MANPFVQHETYEIEVTDPRDGEAWKVTLRVLNAGDEAILRDETRVRTDDEDGAMSLPMGSLRLLTVDRAVVSWTLPLPKSAAAIEVLHDGIFDQIYKECRFASDGEKAADGLPPTEPQTDATSRVDSGATVS